MSGRFSGKVAFVSGAATGIGAAAVRRLIHEDAKVAAFDINAAALDSVAGETGALACMGDITIGENVRASIEETMKFYGGLDVIVNAAGIVIPDYPETVILADWNKTLAVNLTGTMNVCQAALPHLRTRGGGAIVNIASVAAFNSSIGSASYSASKAGVVAYSRNIAYVHGPDNIRCNSLCPGWVRTPMSEMEMATAAEQSGMSVEAEFRRLAALIPLRRIARPEELAACVAFLASEDASFITGVSLVADGGGKIQAASRGF